MNANGMAVQAHLLNDRHIRRGFSGFTLGMGIINCSVSLSPSIILFRRLRQRRHPAYNASPCPTFMLKLSSMYHTLYRNRAAATAEGPATRSLALLLAQSHVLMWHDRRREEGGRPIGIWKGGVQLTRDACTNCPALLFLSCSASLLLQLRLGNGAGDWRECEI